MTQGNKVIFRDFTATETLKTSKNTKGAEIIPPQNLTWTNNWNTFCSFETDQVCADIPLNQCPTCRHYSFWLFFTLIFLLAVWILLANSFVIAYIIKRKRSLRTSLDLLKGSLAVTDLLTGFLLFTTALPNIAWTTRLTSRQLYVETRKLADTPVAIVSATLYLLFIYSTLYHLVLMSYNRFAAIKWPLAPQTVKKTKINLLLLWLLALAAASYPAWFPESFHFHYMYFTFLFLPNISLHTSVELGQAVGLFILLALPYLAMSGITSATAILILRANQKARQHLSESSRAQEQIIRREKAVLRTVTIMKLGFTLTQVPTIIVLGLSFDGIVHPIAFIFMSYCALCNSAINVLIYRANDQDFKNFLTEVFEKPFRRRLTMRSSSPSNTRVTPVV
ncbi:uncharacterized protein LOC143447281 isoform X1 [Clavelina lepadiformis]|uniref:uncharacterized protein LOC143447281 isoform X1 n=1 Tax=Clavelina lepadiformis TaxID=159417 RepID=UPI00404169F4